MPFLCWPYFSDQFLNRNYITDVWRTGLAVPPNAGGVVSKEELRSKVEQVVSNGEIKERAQLFRDATCRAIGEGGGPHMRTSKSSWTCCMNESCRTRATRSKGIPSFVDAHVPLVCCCSG